MQHCTAFSRALEDARVGAYETPVEFANTKLDFSHDVSARYQRFELDITPYLREPLEACEYHGKREITICAPEQTGKSLSWIIALLWSFFYAPGLSIVVYNSDDKCNEINLAKLQPLMRGFGTLAALLDMPRTKARNRYNFPGFVSYFQGAGERISSHSAQLCIADEYDDWDKTGSANLKLIDLRKRGRTFADSLLLKVSSPLGDNSNIWSEFISSSQGYWTLRCLGCGGLTMRSCDIHNLQFESTFSDELFYPILGSERLICPVCKHAHKEKDKPEMNINGGYIHVHAERKEENLYGFQWGALASRWESLSWYNIAQAQLRAGSSNSYENQMFFDNSIRGVQFTRRKLIDKNENILKKRIAPFPVDFVKDYGVISVDVQADEFYYIVRVWTREDVSYVIDCGRVRTIQELEELKRKHDVFGIIDTGGHRINDVRELVYRNPGWVGYKGNPRIGTRTKISETEKKLILANPYVFQSELLDYMYYNTGGKWWIASTISDPDYQTQLLAIKPNNKVLNGKSLENWVSGGADDHYFDCEKMALVLAAPAKAIARKKSKNV